MRIYHYSSLVGGPLSSGAWLVKNRHVVYCCFFYKNEYFFGKLHMLLKSIIEHDKADRFEWIIEDQAFSPSYDLAPLLLPPLPGSRPQVVSLYQFPFVLPVELTDVRKGGRWGRSQIIRRQESLILHQSFNTLCNKDFAVNRRRTCSYLLTYVQNVPETRCQTCKEWRAKL